MFTGWIPKPPNRQVCIDCRGKGFYLAAKGKRHTRRCPRCKGVGSIEVGNTKR